MAHTATFTESKLCKKNIFIYNIIIHSYEWLLYFKTTIMSMGVLTTLETTLMTQESPSKLWATVND